jgi:hypothetical protein
MCELSYGGWGELGTFVKKRGKSGWGGVKKRVKSAERAEKQRWVRRKIQIQKTHLPYAPFKAPRVSLCSVAGDNGELGGTTHMCISTLLYLNFISRYHRTA